MIPFTEYEHPETGRKHRVPWDRDRSTARLHQFKAEAEEFFNKRDIERARAVGIDVPKDAKALSTGHFNKDGTFEVDVLASRIKHSAEEAKERWLPRWQEFCSKPQNEENAEYPAVKAAPRITPAEEPASQTIDEIREAVKRRPGRPRRLVAANV